MSRYIKLPESRITVDADLVVLMFPKDLNQYVMVVRGFGDAPIISGTDKDAFDDFVGAVQAPKPKALEVG